MAAKITNFFERVDEPLPIRWTPSAEPPSKKPKHGPRRPQKVQPPQISFFPNLHCQPSPPFGLHKLMTVPCESHPLYLTDISSWDGRSVRRKIGIMCTRQTFPVWRKIRITISEYSILTQN